MTDRNKDPWKQEEQLKSDYYDRNLKLTEMADEYDCSKATVINWMDKFDLERRNPNDSPLTLRHDSNGYECFNVEVDGSMKKIYHHRLLAMLNHEPGELNGKEVHHEIPIEWLSYEENLSLLNPSEHRQRHNLQQ